MYQRILVPVDGSALSDRAIAASIGLARQLGAAITGFVAEQPRGARKPAQGAARLRRVEDEDTLTPEDAQGVLERFAAAAHAAGAAGLGVNAGHDLSRVNLADFLRGVGDVLEVSIGHALVADALELGMAETVRAYRRCIRQAYAPAAP